MRLYEYRIEEVFVEAAKGDHAMTEALNKFGREGWRVVSLVEPRTKSRVKVLLERRAKKGKETGRESAKERRSGAEVGSRRSRARTTGKQK